MWRSTGKLAVNWRELRGITARILVAISCLFLPLERAHAGKCSKIRLSANCAGTPHAYRLKQIHSGRSANANSASKMLIRLSENEMGSESSRKILRKNNALSGGILIRPADKQTAEILSQLGIPVLPGLPPIIIVLPEDNDKNDKIR